jgi:hypothetical protein
MKARTKTQPKQKAPVAQTWPAEKEDLLTVEELASLAAGCTPPDC